MLKITGIDHIVLRTNKRDEMLRFYCEILGCHIERTVESFGLIQLRAGSNLIDLLCINEEPNTVNPNLEHFCLRVASGDHTTIQSLLQQAGIETYRLGERYSSKGMGYSFYLKDPEANEIELVVDQAM